MHSPAGRTRGSFADKSGHRSEAPQPPALKIRARYLRGQINTREGNGLWRQTAGVGVPAPPLNVRVILCTSFNLCDPLSLHLWKGDSFHRVVMRITWRFVDQLHSAWYIVSAMWMFDKENKTDRKVRRAGETESALLPRKLQLRPFWISTTASVGHASLPLCLSRCLHLLLGDYRKPATVCEIKLRFRRANAFFKEHFRGKRGPWLSDTFHRFCERYQERVSVWFYVGSFANLKMKRKKIRLKGTSGWF